MTKKINPKIVALALLILSFLAAGGVAVKESIAPGGGGIEPDPVPPIGGE